jgi:hypothetical protein
MEALFPHFSLPTTALTESQPRCISQSIDYAREAEEAARLPVAAECHSLVYHARYCSELAQERGRGQQGQTLVERSKMLGHPGSEKRGQAHAGLRAFGTACATADITNDDQGRTRRSAKLLCVGPGTATKKNSSGKKRSYGLAVYF